jgi:hypothetical protein
MNGQCKKSSVMDAGCNEVYGYLTHSCVFQEVRIYLSQQHRRQDITCFFPRGGNEELAEVGDAGVRRRRKSRVARGSDCR